MSTIEKSIKILNFISNSKRSVKITELNSNLLFPKSTIHRILSVLLKYSLVEKEKDSPRYKLGLQMLDYSNSYMNYFHFRQAAVPILYEISRMTELTAFLAIWNVNCSVCIESVAPPPSVDYHPLLIEIGKRMPFHCASSAKVLLAYKDPKEINEIIHNNSLKKYTLKTIVDPKKLEEHLRKIKKNSFAICDEEIEEGVKAIAAPIMDINGEVIASISITGLSNRKGFNNIEKLIKILVNSSQKLSKILGYIGSSINI